MGRVVPCGVDFLTVPAPGPKAARANPQRGLFPGAKGTTSAVQAGRGAPRGHRGWERGVSPSPAACRESAFMPHNTYATVAPMNRSTVARR